MYVVTNIHIWLLWAPISILWKLWSMKYFRKFFTGEGELVQ